MPSIFDAIDAVAATAIYQAVGVAASYYHIESEATDAVSIVDLPDVQQAPAGFDGYTVISQHEIAVQHVELSSAPAVGDQVTFGGVTYKIDDIVGDDLIEFRAVIVEVPV